MCSDRVINFVIDMQEDLKLILDLILPEFLVTHFKLVKVDQTGNKIEVHLEENTDIPEGFNPSKIICYGFYEQSRVKDFSLRGKHLYLLINRCRWLNKETKEVVSRD